MSRMLRIGLLLLVAMWVSDSTASAQAPKYGLVYQIYNDGDNVLYLCDVNFMSDCQNFAPAYAWDVATPSKPVPWVNCEDDFYDKKDGAKGKDGPRPGLTKGLPTQLPPDADASFLTSRLPEDRGWPGTGPIATPRWNPRESANVLLIGRKVLNIGSREAPVLKEVALFSLNPMVADGLLLNRTKGREGNRRPIDVPWKKVRRFFALEVASDGTTPDPTEAIPATSLQRDGEFLHQWTFRYRGITVPAILRE